MKPPSQHRTRIKFCGMTRAGDVRLAGELGVDCVGFVFVPGSPRALQPQQARAMRQALAPMVDAVALFKDARATDVREVVRQLRPSLLQFHGNEDDAWCRGFGVPYIKAIAMGQGAAALSARELQLRWPAAVALLFDGHAPGADGGRGECFDWSTLPEGLLKPAIVAGGLDADNVQHAIRTARPWGVDVCSGIELEPGIKDGDAMRAFVSAVRSADCVDLGDDDDQIKACHACGR